MLKPVIKFSQRFFMILFLLSSLMYQWQPATASQTAGLSSPPARLTSQTAGPTSSPKSPQGLSGPGNSILLSGFAPGGLINDSYVQVPYSSSLNPSGGSITIEAWVKRTDATRCETLVGNDFQVSYWLGFCPKLRFYLNGGASVDSKGVVPANVWTHVAVTFDGATTKMYINGNLDSYNTTLAGPLTPANNTPLGIGFDIETSFTNNYFEGEIQEVRIWNTAHTQAQIKSSMFQIFGKPQPNLMAEWPFGNDTKDYSGNGNDGTPVTTASFPIDGAIPHNLFIPQVSLATTPALDCSCDTSTKYANAVQVNAGDNATAYLMHTASDLWVCFYNLTAPIGTHDNWAAVYLDVNHTRVDPAQPNHYSLEVHHDGSLRTRVGDGSGNYTVPTSSIGTWNGIYRNTGGEFPTLSAEFKISKALLGGWSNVIGLALAQHWITGAGDDRLWPALAVWNLPSTWSSSTLGGIGPSRTYSGKVVYKPRTSPTTVGIPGGTVNLIGSAPDGSQALAGVVTSNLDGTFSLTSTDDFPQHRLVLDPSSIPQGYAPSSASSQAPGQVVDFVTINFGSAPGGIYPNNVFSLGDPKPYVVDNANGDYFLIIATDQMIADGVFNDFVDFKTRLGFQVELQSVENINKTFLGADLPAKIRNLEIDRRDTYGSRFRYVLLVGPHSVIPHRFFAPYNEKPSDCVPGTGLPTDWYYADLVSNFDSNGNGCLADGIWGDPSKRAPGYTPDSGIKWNPSVAVGRLPFTSEDAVRQALSDILGFEEQGNNFKRDTMLAASMMDNKGECWNPPGDPSGSYG